MRKLILFLLLFQCIFSFAQEKLSIEMTQIDTICFNNLKLKYDTIKKRFGFIDNDGNYIIEPQYKCASEFIEGSALVTKRDKKCDPNSKKAKDWYYINKNNEKVFPPRMESRYRWENNIKSSP